MLNVPQKCRHVNGNTKQKTPTSHLRSLRAHSEWTQDALDLCLDLKASSEGCLCSIWKLTHHNIYIKSIKVSIALARRCSGYK